MRLEDGIMRRGQARRSLSPEDVALNHEIAPRRRPVEKVFGTLRPTYGRIIL